MSSVPVLPSNVAAWSIAPWAATVPVLMLPSVRLRVPGTLSVVPALTVYVEPPPLKTTSASE